MKVEHRGATPNDAKRLCELRRQSINELAVKGMSIAEAASWAEKLTVAGMQRKLSPGDMGCRDRYEGGWVGAIRGDRFERLYAALNLPAEALGLDCSACSKD
jgi:putative acetyltransferase